MAWRKEPLTCWFCGKHLKNTPAKNAHLTKCPGRLLNRYFYVKPYLFIVCLNPLNTIMNNINEIIQETHDPTVLVGTLKAYMLTKQIFLFTALELLEKYNFDDGEVIYNEFTHALDYDDYQRFISLSNDFKQEVTLNKPQFGLSWEPENK